ncbi:asparaginase [Rhodococcus qingshengii]|uniref:Asparaginase n=1 Tax=Rhodococcus qingshengii TaxID=334542 RepID=A0AAW6LXP6_RHOSG|nr:asparaginase [Rhodococcus qingshengii]MDE8649902.1 asparaginase [Rhodococcus qingshengii]
MYNQSFVAAPPAHALLATQTRGELVENIHHGSVVATGAEGEVLFAVGEPTALFYARSALKPLQTLAMLRNGLALDGELLALATASHSGSRAHVEAALAILRTHGLEPKQLRNFPSMPYGEQERDEWVRSGGSSDQLTQNCSGKHAAMLVTCRINDWPLDDYLHIEHPLQQAVQTTVEEFTGEIATTWSVDGCGTPVFATSLNAIACVYGHFASAPLDTPEGRIADAMRTNPAMVAGEARDTTAIMRAQPGLLAKDGADGIQLIGLPDGRAVAVKIADGGEHVRMRVAARALQYLDAAESDLTGLAATPALGGGKVVGELRAVDFLDYTSGVRQ